jgi:hypothetical protein
VLIIVAGLASILLVLAVAFLARMRSDSQETNAILSEVQSRLMMHAALMYVQETSRLGWGDTVGEAYGWTDVRDGGLGPRGARPAGGAGAGSAIPAPEWWTKHSGWPAYKWDADDADLPPIGARRGGWPLPGTATRCPMAVCEVPPYATQLTFSYTPVMPPLAYGDPSWGVAWAPYPGSKSDPTWTFNIYSAWPNAWIPRIFAGGKGMLDPQPVLESWGDFRNGKANPAATSGDWTHERFDSSGRPIPGATQQLAVIPGTENNSWFRIYRETQADHDCVDNVGQPGTEWWDKVALYDPTQPKTAGTPKVHNWSVFIVACGAGGTRGYRFWNDAEISAWEGAHGLPAGTGRALEPVTAEESGLFPDQSTFAGMLASSRILWFRCEWSALESGSRTTGIYNDGLWRASAHPWMHDGVMQWDPKAWPPGSYHTLVSPMVMSYNFNAQYAMTEVTGSASPDISDTRSNSPKVYAGNIRWLQRLDRDPVLW